MKKVSIIILILIGATTILAQNNKVNLNQLVGSSWVIKVSPKCATQGWEFTNSKLTTFIEGASGKSQLSSDFYLSSYKDSYFKTNEVGKAKEGRYIIVNSKVRRGNSLKEEVELNVYEIISFTNTSMVIRTSNGTTLTFEIKK